MPRHQPSSLKPINPSFFVFFFFFSKNGSRLPTKIFEAAEVPGTIAALPQGEPALLSAGAEGSIELRALDSAASAPVVASDFGAEGETKVEARSRAESNFDMTQCVVCLCDFEQGDVLMVLPCQHQFHKVRLGCRSSALSSATFHPSLSLPHRRTACSRG